MKKITFLINSISSGGAERALVNLSKRLAEDNNDVEIICLEKAKFYSVPNNIKVTYISELSGKENYFIKLLFLFVLASKLKKYLKSNNITLVQSHVYRANYVNVLAKILGSKHTAQIVNTGVISYYKKENVPGRINLFLIKRLYPLADLIVWKSKAMMRDGVVTVGLRNNHQIVIYNPCDLGYVQKLSNEKAGFKFKKNKIYIATLGRLVKLKRNSDLLQALVKLPENIEVLLIGDGAYRNTLASLANSLHIQDRVHFIGNVHNPFKYLKKCDLFVHTSETEGFPNVLIEALSCELPVIASDCLSGPREILFNSLESIQKNIEPNNFVIGDYGIIFPVGDVTALTNAIKYIIREKEDRNKYILRSKERAKCYSLSKIADSYSELFIAVE